MRPAFSLLAALGLAVTTLWAPTGLAQSIVPDEPAAIDAQGSGADMGGGPAMQGESPRPMMARARMASTEYPIIRGNVVLQQTGPNQTAVTVTVTGLEPGSTHVNHIHGGSCTGSILFPLQDLVADKSGVARSVSSVAGAINVENWWVNVHAGSALPSPGITCGKVEGPPMVRTRPAPGPAPRPDGGERPGPAPAAPPAAPERR